VDESPKLAQQFHVEGIPMLLFFKDGKVAETSVGLLTKADLGQHLDSLIQIQTQLK
jgi:thioredoxin 1